MQAFPSLLFELEVRTNHPDVYWPQAAGAFRQSLNVMNSPDKLVPFRWPPAWTDTARLTLFDGSPINCLLCEDLAAAKPVAEAARSKGFTVLEWKALGAAPLADVKWNSPAQQTVVTGLEWPRIRLSARKSADADSGPTGAPWIDSNTWVARLAAVRAPHRPVWLGFERPANSPAIGDAPYLIAIADSAAAGARWIISFDEGLRSGLLSGNSDAKKTWQSITSALAFFEQHRDWTAWEPDGSIGILSSFSGNDEFMGQEVLNLAARRNLLYRVLDRSTPASHKLDGLRAVLYVDGEAPSPELKAKLAAFARAGGLLIVPHVLASEFAGEKRIECPVAGYDVRTFGKGSVAAATREWEDPFFVAADIHSLASRRNDPVRLFNARSLWEHYSSAPGGRGALLQLVGFTGRVNPSVAVAPARPWRSATLHTIGSTAALEPVTVDGRSEFHLPPFSHYAALEFKS